LVDSVGRPLRTITASNGDDTTLVSPFLVEHFSERPGQRPRCRSVDRPLGTVTASRNRGSLIQPFLVQYNGESGALSVDEPLGSVTTRDRFGLVQPRLARLDIMFRMLSVRELARAQGFPDSFMFTGTKTDAVRQIGNAVPVSTAEALVYEALVA
jgi:DNA (cytosine-5)-methyltransferase 1